MDSNLASLTLAVLINGSGARCLIQQGDLDLELLVASIALHDRVRARATRRYLVNERPHEVCLSILNVIFGPSVACLL
jgi:hypothetical protein